MTPSQVCLLRAALKIGGGNPRWNLERFLVLSGWKYNSGLESKNWCEEAHPRKMLRKQPLTNNLVARRWKIERMAGYDEIFHFTPRTSPAFGLADRQVTCCWAASSRGTCGYRPHNQFFNHRLLTRGASNVGDVMTSSWQNSHGGSPNGGWRRCATSSPTAHTPSRYQQA